MGTGSLPWVKLPGCGVNRTPLSSAEVKERVFYSKTKEMHQFLKFILFCSSTLHILDGLSVHHQESKTVHTASGVCERDSADCLLAGTR